MEVIYVDFTKGFYSQLSDFVTRQGAGSAKDAMLAQGYHPAFVNVIIKRIYKKRG